MDLSKRFKENVLLRIKIQTEKKKMQLHKVKEHVSDLTTTYKEVTGCLGTISGSINFFQKKIYKVNNLSNDENKVPMKTADADTVKDVLRLVLTSPLDVKDDLKSGADNLFKMKESIMKYALIDADYNQRSYQCNNKLIDNINELMDVDSYDYNETISVQSLINTQMFVESELVASSPMPIDRNSANFSIVSIMK